MRIREKAMKALSERGMFDTQAVEIIEKYLNSPLGEMMKDRFDDDESNYPPQMFVGVWIGLKQTALEWIDEKKPKHWARPMFAE